MSCSDDEYGVFESGGGGAFSGNSGKSYRIVSCVLRQSTVGGGWDVVDDANHTPVGVSSVTESGGDIVVAYDFTAATVGSGQVTLDEGYAATALTAGASVGLSSSIISMYHPFEVRISGTSYAVQSYLGTDGVEWSGTANVSAGTHTFTHPAQTHADSAGSSIGLSMRQEGANDQVSVQAVSKTGFTIGTCNAIAGRTNNATIVSENTGTKTVSWNGTDTYTITHATSSAANDATVTSRDPRYHAAIDSSSTTQIAVKFYDVSTGTAYTGATRPCDVTYMRGGYTPSTMAGGLDVYVKRGPVPVDVANVAGSSANLWFYGVFEV